jgi:hypothetical protein
MDPVHLLQVHPADLAPPAAPNRGLTQVEGS